MIGQLSNKEFIDLYSIAAEGRKGFNPVTRKAWIKYGKETFNYYHQHDDNSWTCYDCKTIQIFT
jgi:hypothetical protein